MLITTTKATYPVVEAAKAFKTIPEKIKYIFNNSEFAMRLLSCEFVYSVNRIPEICDSLVEIDNAMKWGMRMNTAPSKCGMPSG
jgi:3-hydroxyacyl-CoA dehydrogenase